MNYKAMFLGRILKMLVAAAVLGGAVMLLWNLVAPGLFAGARPIDYLHGLGLLVLSRILFGGFRGRGGWHGGWHGRQHWEKWAAMTPEEREQFRKNRSGIRGNRHEAGGDKSEERA
ncbi:MAG: hypothetical protein ACHP7O_09070 [Burkholderiales bacterium]